MTDSEALVVRLFPNTHGLLTRPPFEAVDWDRLPIGFLVTSEAAETGVDREAILRRVEKAWVDAGIVRLNALWAATERSE